MRGAQRPGLPQLQLQLAAARLAARLPPARLRRKPLLGRGGGGRGEQPLQLQPGAADQDGGLQWLEILSPPPPHLVIHTVMKHKQFIRLSEAQIYFHNAQLHHCFISVVLNEADTSCIFIMQKNGVTTFSLPITGWWRVDSRYRNCTRTPDKLPPSQLSGRCGHSRRKMANLPVQTAFHMHETCNICFP